MHNNEDIEAKISKFFHGVTNQTTGGKAIDSPLDKVIAGADDRRDYYDLKNLNVSEQLLQLLIDSTVILTEKDKISKQDDGSYLLKVKPFLRNRLRACSGERFGNQYTGGWCSGFVVGSDVVVTAGHCGETENKIQNTAYVFGFRAMTADDLGTTIFSKDQVYFGKELIAHDLSDTGDFAIVRVDRKIIAPGAGPLRIRERGSIGIGSNVGVIGYPSGLPVKVSFGSNTVVIRDDDPWLLANLDTYGGNSGSAVFNTNGEVEGILVRGAQDYVIDSGKSCFRSNRIMNSEGREFVTKASVFVDRIPCPR